MLDLTIERLHLQIENATGQEHRIRSITNRAVSILAERVGERWAIGERIPDTQTIESLSVPPMSFNLGRMSDEQAAVYIADAMLEVLSLKLGI